MGNPRGFLQIGRKRGPRRPVTERLGDHQEFESTLPIPELREQASRCMDCGVPFCHRACPLGNLIPEWNDHVYRGLDDEAVRALEATNNFPEVTGRVCPAPCEASCVLNLQETPVTIKDVERHLGDAMLASGVHLRPRPATSRSGQSVAVIGSGPAGLAAAQQLAREGHDVTVFERDDRVGGLLRYGIPDFKLEKRILDARLTQLEGEGVVFRTGVDVGVAVSVVELWEEFDAILLAIGASRPRELDVRGRDAEGVHLAMEYLKQANRRIAGAPVHAEIDAARRHVVVLGGGDTGSDCLGTALRQGAQSVTQVELMPAPPGARLPSNPWPEWPVILRTSSSQEEGGTREFALQTCEIVKDDAGHVRALSLVGVDRDASGRLSPVAGTERELPCDLLLLAMGFVGVEPLPLLSDLGVRVDASGRVERDGSATPARGVFVAGDAARGASLVVWAIAEGRSAAAEISAFLASERR